jgi:hypothetical protein
MSQLDGHKVSHATKDDWRIEMNEKRCHLFKTVEDWKVGSSIRIHFSCSSKQLNSPAEFRQVAMLKANGP